MKLYDAIAPVYSLLHRLSMPSKSHLNAKLHLQEPGKLLDIGCGNAHSWSHWSKHECWGVDASAKMLQTAPREFQERLKHADARNLPFRDAEFDIVVLAHVLSTTPDPEHIMSEAHRVLKPGGLLILQNHDSQNWHLLDRLIQPFARMLGVQLPFFITSHIDNASWILLDTQKLGRFSYFKLITLRKL